MHIDSLIPSKPLIRKSVLFYSLLILGVVTTGTCIYYPSELEVRKFSCDGQFLTIVIPREDSIKLYHKQVTIDLPPPGTSGKRFLATISRVKYFSAGELALDLDINDQNNWACELLRQPNRIRARGKPQNLFSLLFLK